MALAPLPELEEQERLAAEAGSRAEVVTLAEVSDARARYFVRAFCLGSPRPEAPAIGFFGGVHGLERIGSQVVLSYLADLLDRRGKDDALERLLENVRLVFMPIVNPAGMVRATRANANGVDLMRNAPLDSREGVTFLVGGQRLGPWLPWYRGRRGAMEAESEALCALVRRELLSRPFSLALDCHSGFGLRDRIWFPHAHTREPFLHIAEIHVLQELFRSDGSRRQYLFEPQSRRYLTHGDLWDYLCAEAGPGVFIPLTLEMGSWRWVRGNPRQALRRLGIFNPLQPERAARVRRHHFAWLEFLCAAAWRYADWMPDGMERKRRHHLALARWFGFV